MQKYEVISEIGQGQFGLVKKIRRNDGKIMVWKQIKYGSMTRQQKNQLVNQVNILKELNNESIVKYYEHIIDKKGMKVYIVMQFCPGGDLGKAIEELKKKKQLQDEDIIWKIFYQLVSALNYCHRKKILHRDLKPANIFIDGSQSIVKIGDFGLSKQLGQHSQFAKTYVGTPYYMSPQQIKGKKYNEKCDIWSLGCIIYQLATFRRPFGGSNLIELGRNIQSGKYQPLPSRYSCNLQNIIHRMLSNNPEHRPSTSDLLNIPFLSIRSEEKELKLRYDQLRKRQDYLKEKEQQYRQKIKLLESVVGPEKIQKMKKTNSILDSNKGKIAKSLTISI